MRIKSLAAVAAVASVAMIGTALPASAEKDGRCDPGDGCLYYNGNRGGSLIDYVYNDTNLAGDRFLSAGAGRGQSVKNNAASAWNNYTPAHLRVYYNENYLGPYDDIPGGGWENLVHTWNDNASLRWVW